MTRILLFLLCPFLLSAVPPGPKDSLKPHISGFSGVYFGAQVNCTESAYLSNDQFRRLWPGFDSLTYTSKHGSNGNGIEINGTQFDAGVIFNNRRRLRKHSQGCFQTQFGFSFFSSRSIGHSYRDVQSVRQDTLVMPGINTQYVDSVIRKDYYLSYFSQYAGIHLGGSYIFQCGRKISLFTGLKGKMLYSINPLVSENIIINRGSHTGHDPVYPGTDFTSFTSTSYGGWARATSPSLLFLADASFGANFQVLTFKRTNSGIVLSPGLATGIEILKLEHLQPIWRSYLGLSFTIKYVL